MSDIVNYTTEDNAPETVGQEYYPPKPQEEPVDRSMGKSAFSFALFIIIFYLVFKWSIAYIFVLAGVLLIHELGHYLAMRFYKYRDLSIFFIPLMGAFASGEKETVTQKQSAVVLLAGPVPGMILGAVLYLLGNANNNAFLIKTSEILIFLNLFNLLPIFPLDGGKLVKTLYFESSATVHTVFLVLSILLMSFIAIVTRSYLLFLLPLLLLMQISAQSQTGKMRKAMKGKGIDTNKSYSEITDKEYWLIRDELGIQSRLYSRYITPGMYRASANESMIMKQVKAVLQHKPVADLGVLGKILFTLFWLGLFAIPLIAVIINTIIIKQ
jgi:stage IV sporulation protein FB